MTSWPFGDLRMFGYEIIYADPPWDFVGGGDRNARKHYETMTPAEIAALPVGQLARGDCLLYMWVTDPFIAAAIDVLRAWGFRYVSVGFHWAKRTKLDNGWHFGTGYGTRANVETCLLAANGTLGLALDRSVRRLIVEPVREHSRKPDRVRDDIVRLWGDRPRCELFARTSAPGWESWGLEASKFDAAPPALAL